MRADVEDDAVGPDRAGGVDGLAQRRHGLLVELVVRAREVAEVDRVDDARPRCRPPAPALGNARAPQGRGSGNRQARGLWTKSCSAFGADRLRPLRRRLDPTAEVAAEEHAPYDSDVSPSASAWRRARPGFLHIGSVRTFLFNWLFARAQGGEVLLRIENTDTSREVAEATEQIQRSLELARHRLGRARPLPARPDGGRAAARAAARRGGQGVRGRGRDPLPHARRGRRRAGTTSFAAGSRCRTRASRTS